MRWWTLAALLVVCVAAQDTANFNHYPCYDVPVENRMPNTLDNLVALLEKYERTTSYTNIDTLAEMIIKRYRTNGMVYRPKSGMIEAWVLGEVDKETEKEKITEKITRPTEDFPPGTFDGREECGLHMLMSHSTDTYPFDHADDVWDGTISRKNRGDKSSGSSSSSYNTKTNTRGLDQFEPAVHATELGVMETPYGPVAAGTLIAGLATIGTNPSASVSTVLQSDAENLPPGMESKSIKGIYASTLSGDLAQVALMSTRSETNNAVYVGPPGRYYTSTTCSKFYSLETNKYSLLSRAELFAGIDALLFKYAYDKSSSSFSNMKLSQLLRLYYSEKGLPNMPEFKACNRLSLYSLLDRTEIQDQALNFMYAYQSVFPTIKDKVEMAETLSEIETDFKQLLSPAFKGMEDFIKSYRYDDEGYNQCLYGSSTTSGGFGSSVLSNDLPASEGMADLIAVYSGQGGNDDARNQRQMIADVARRLGVSYSRSRLGVVRGQDGQWLLELTNLTNVGDWACNFTSDTTLSVGGTDSISKVLSSLTKFYTQQYDKAKSDLETSSGRSQVILWQVYGSQPGDVKNETVEFRKKFPDVRIIFVGRNQAPYQDLLRFEDDFILDNGKSVPDLVNLGLNAVVTSPRFFIYPACDPNNSSNTYNYQESNHNYKGAVTPNFTTYIIIPAQNFHYSEEFELKVTGGVRTCFSRTNHYALENKKADTVEPYLKIKPNDDTLICVGGPNDEEEDTATFKWPCDRNVTECNPVFMSITGLSTSSSTGSCVSTGSDSTLCEYPHQIKYELTHKGMICGASSAAPALLLLVLAIVQHYFR
ncbi:uncharacterized protein LOC108673560 isoform X2 [Hyalella azteca]|uniref:Uncharacterized protein LOC108673560 isoform X2 n=1 Tax=Hyalella azteca TaxID=294128 RepID=A0A8B7NVF4_HYAAZ|nr:uncharacterized protein LOC108673560 isoform X2 [Hyalella azteca]